MPQHTKALKTIMHFQLYTNSLVNAFSVPACSRPIQAWFDGFGVENLMWPSQSPDMDAFGINWNPISVPDLINAF